MADLSDLILGEQRGRFRDPPPMVKGEVAENDGGDLFVVVPEFDPQLRFGPCEWIGPAGAARGDACLVLFDDEREPWVIVPGVVTSAGEQSTYAFIVPPQLNAANKIYFDLFNDPTSGKEVHLTKLFALPALDVDAGGTNVPPLRADVYGTTSVATGGTAFSRSAQADKSLAAFWRFNMAGPALPAGITGRMAPTAAGTDRGFLWPSYISVRYQDAGAFQMQFMNLVLEGPDPMVLNPGMGIRVQQSTVTAGAAQLGWMGAFEVVA